MSTQEIATREKSVPKNDVREEWRAVFGFPGYFVSSLGRIRGKSGRILRQQSTGNGYLFVTLCRAEGKRMALVHRLIAKAFRGEELEQVNHVDGNRRNNLPGNLEWVSRSENQLHAVDIGRKPCGINSHLCTKLDDAKVAAIRELNGEMSQAAIGRRFGISQTHVGKIIRGVKWRNHSGTKP